MKYTYGVGVLVAAIMFILGGNLGGALFSRIGLFVVGGAVLAMLLDTIDRLIVRQRERME